MSFHLALSEQRSFPLSSRMFIWETTEQLTTFKFIPLVFFHLHFKHCFRTIRLAVTSFIIDILCIVKCFPEKLFFRRVAEGWVFSICGIVPWGAPNGSKVRFVWNGGCTYIYFYCLTLWHASIHRQICIACWNTLQTAQNPFLRFHGGSDSLGKTFPVPKRSLRRFVFLAQVGASVFGLQQWRYHWNKRQRKTQQIWKFGSTIF